MNEHDCIGLYSSVGATAIERPWPSHPLPPILQGRYAPQSYVGEVYVSDAELKRQLDAHDQTYQRLGADIDQLVSGSSENDPQAGYKLALQMDWAGFYARWQGWYQNERQSWILAASSVQEGLDGFDAEYTLLRDRLIAQGGTSTSTLPAKHQDVEGAATTITRNVTIATVAIAIAAAIAAVKL